ncbi:glycosyltransferase family 1 protein [Paenibacillus sambharensis]|uniref:Glycosyltransferase family 1 protein n=1 Tax=Paenibacillus sambharensis TaxID=1803190 RepID=A0A2W1LUR0_9BACL|nr:glycosyltransferase family 4 protein [Paenibacillus sambharensis]PZD95521.1 glycosyltransferase family 1 protein [Paenibacillus sambharensis]
MKVAHLCTSALSHKILVDKLALLRKKGYDIHLVSSEEGYDPNLVDKYGFELRFVHMNRPIKPLDDLRSIFRVAKVLKQEQYDIVHTHTAKAGVVGRIAARLARVPVVIHTTHGLPFYEGQSRLKNRLFCLLEKIGAAFGHAIASQNREDIAKIREYAPRATVYYEGNGVDLEALDAKRAAVTPEMLSELRRQWSIRPDQKVMLMGARFEPVKDHFFLLEGLKRLKQLGQTDYVCVLAGKGELEDEVRSRIKEYGLEEQVRLIGHTREIYSWIELADVIVLSSEKEGIPRIVMEAMTYSKPVVASDVIGTRETVTNERNGLLVPYKDADALASALNKVLGDGEYASRLGQEGRRMVEQEFTEELVVERIHAYYGELIKKLGLTEKAKHLQSVTVDTGYAEGSNSV